MRDGPVRPFARIDTELHIQLDDLIARRFHHPPGGCDQVLLRALLDLEEQLVMYLKQEFPHPPKYR